MKVYIVEYVYWEQSHIKAVFDTYEKAIEYADKHGKCDVYEWELNTEIGCIV